MHPVVISSPFERFPRIGWTAHFFLFLPIVIGCFLGILTFDAILLSFLLRFLLVRDFRRLYKVLLSEFDCAESAFIMLRLLAPALTEICVCKTYHRHLGISIIGTHVTNPFARAPCLADDSVTVTMHSHPTFLT